MKSKRKGCLPSGALRPPLFGARRPSAPAPEGALGDPAEGSKTTGESQRRARSTEAASHVAVHSPHRSIHSFVGDTLVYTLTFAARAAHVRTLGEGRGEGGTHIVRQYPGPRRQRALEFFGSSRKSRNSSRLASIQASQGSPLIHWGVLGNFQSARGESAEVARKPGPMSRGSTVFVRAAKPPAARGANDSRIARIANIAPNVACSTLHAPAAGSTRVRVQKKRSHPGRASRLPRLKVPEKPRSEGRARPSFRVPWPFRAAPNPFCRKARTPCFNAPHVCISVRRPALPNRPRFRARLRPRARAGGGTNSARPALGASSPC